MPPSLCIASLALTSPTQGTSAAFSAYLPRESPQINSTNPIPPLNELPDASTANLVPVADDWDEYGFDDKPLTPAEEAELDRLERENMSASAASSGEFQNLWFFSWMAHADIRVLDVVLTANTTLGPLRVDDPKPEEPDVHGTFNLGTFYHAPRLGCPLNLG